MTPAFSPTPPRPESLYAAVTRWAAHARPSTLRLLATLGLGGAGGILLLDWTRWPLAGVLLTLSTIGAWGLVEQRAAHPRTVLVAATESALTGLGTVVAALVALGLLFWLMGPAPVL